MNDLLHFLNASPTAFHAADAITQILKTRGYRELAENQRWELVPGGKYYVTRNSSAVIAFVQPVTPLSGFAIALSHLDSPGLRIKWPSLRTVAGCLVAPVERYSANIDSTWLDHPLTIAGRVVTRELEERLIAFPGPVAVIPNLAIHLNRNANQGTEYNPQTQLSAILGDVTPEEFRRAVANLARCAPEDILDTELCLADATPATVVGLASDMITSSRLDNLLAADAMLCGLCVLPEDKTTRRAPVAFFADNEEIGSRTPQGADSCFLRDILERIVLAGSGTREDFLAALASSQLLSVDAAHAVHPNYMDRYDLSTSPLINRGIVLKRNANGRYATTPSTASSLMLLCEAADIPVQTFLIRSDLPCGSTVGPMTAARLGIPAADIGNAMWAMHSVRETAGLTDQKWMRKLLAAYFAQ